ncbi:hypothetical protein K469DRAFT_750637 [Zopfia rhizophila CBS 207.26]|uniref:MYND-type zinc finger protein samB n=1 Tax=Zopfia rhizophila CBS 207.26 TaxID=1314779 RepID=A0A6A6E3G5_9PEZI|nr:hypothetical protein K469DRAFT_750637 [Zopfia rhizophila CBS 207.26]
MTESCPSLASASSPLCITPPPRPPASRGFRLTFHASHATRTLVQANRELAAYHTKAALALYTKVLTKLSLGHPVAFLNRSLCYLVLGFPHLAATDAYRALLGAQWVKHTNPGNVHGRQLLNMGLFTQEVDTSKETWKTEPACYAGQGTLAFLDVELASIAVKPHQRVKPRLDKNKVDWQMVLHMTNDTMMKAYYRLALALWKCGGGGWKSALDMLCAADAAPCCTEDDRAQLQELQNKILEEIGEVMKEETDTAKFLKDYVPENADPIFKSEESGIRGLLKSRFTKMRREIYPWDIYSLTWENEHQVLREMNEEIDKKTFGVCRLHTQKDHAKGPKVSFKAKRKLSCSEIVFNELSCMHVVVSDTGSNHQLSCDACGSSLDVSGALCVQANKFAKDFEKHIEEEGWGKKIEQARKCMVSIGSQSTIDAFDADDKDENITYSFEQISNSSRLPPTPRQRSPSKTIKESKAPKHNPPTGFQLCPFCRRVAYCSLTCHNKASVTHHGYLCQTTISDLPLSATAKNAWSIPSSTAMNLLDQLVLRTLSSLVERNTHPLTECWIRILHGELENPRILPDDPDPSSGMFARPWDDDESISIQELYPSHRTLEEIVDGRPSDRKQLHNTIPWSFNTNVVQPIEALFQIGCKESREVALELALDAQRFDGWVLETLRAKIASAMRISRFPRFEMGFNEDGQIGAQSVVSQKPVENPFMRGVLEANLTPRHDTNNGLALEGAGAEETVWIASVHPITTAVKVADDDVEPNVKIFERSGAVVCQSVDNVPVILTQGLENVTFRGAASMKEKDDASVIEAGETLFRSKLFCPWTNIDDRSVSEFRKRNGEVSHSSFDFDSLDNASSEVIVSASEDEDGDIAMLDASDLDTHVSGEFEYEEWAGCAHIGYEDSEQDDDEEEAAKVDEGITMIDEMEAQDDGVSLRLKHREWEQTPESAVRKIDVDENYHAGDEREGQNKGRRITTGKGADRYQVSHETCSMI